jgi:hypothetical protein
MCFLVAKKWLYELVSGHLRSVRPGELKEEAQWEDVQRLEEEQTKVVDPDEHATPLFFNLKYNPKKLANFISYIYKLFFLFISIKYISLNFIFIFRFNSILILILITIIVVKILIYIMHPFIIIKNFLFYRNLIRIIAIFLIIFLNLFNRDNSYLHYLGPDVEPVGPLAVNALRLADVVYKGADRPKFHVQPDQQFVPRA